MLFIATNILNNITLLKSMQTRECMKKVLLVGLVVLALSGCGEKKVTEEMLIGDWDCNITQQFAKWKNGAFQDFDEAKREKDRIIYKIYDGVLVKSGPNDAFHKNWESGFTYRAIRNLKYIEIIDNYVNSIESKIDYISENEYKLTGIGLLIGNDSESKLEAHNIKHKFEEHCTRIKY